MGSIRTVDDERDLRNLRRVAKRVKKFGTADLMILQQTMTYEAIRFERDNVGQLCAGLAAPQVGTNLRVIMLRNSNNKFDQSWTFMFNPSYDETRGGYQRMNEGCLSVPGYTGQTVRPAESLFHYYNSLGERIPENGSMRVEGGYAAALCHEIDHLNGVLFIDNEIHLNGSQREMVEEQERAESQV